MSSAKKALNDLSISDKRTTDLEKLNRSKKVYKYFFVEMTLIILIVFFEPTFRRLAQGGWQRGKYPYEWTLSLDVHAAVAFLFLFLILIQLFLGYQQAKNPSLKSNHVRLGNTLFYVIIPLFLLANLWVTFGRFLTTNLEESILYRDSPMIAILAIVEILAFLLWYVIRSFKAIKQGDVLLHLDGIFGAFLILSGFPFIRFLFAIVWSVQDVAPFTVTGGLFITLAIIFGHLVLGYFLAGRLRQNFTPLVTLVIVSAALAILGADYYIFWG